MGKDAGKCLLAYGLAILAVAGAVLVRWLVAPWVGDFMPLATVYVAVAVAVWFGGYRPALLVVVLGFLVCAYLFFEPSGVIGLGEVRDRIRLIVYLLSCGIIIGFGEAIRAARRRAEAGRQQLATMTESMAAPITRCSRDLRYLWVSKPYADWIGRPAEEIIGRPILDIIGPEAFAQLRPYFEQVLAGRKVQFEEAVDYQKRGRRWINAVYTPTLDASGVVDGWVTVVLDVTERKQMEEALRQSEERFARFMHSLPGLAWIKDLQGRYVFANDAALKVFRCSWERLHGQTDLDIFPPETAVQFEENDRKALASEAGVQIIETLEHADGMVHHSLVNKFPILGPDGKAALVGGMAIDVTDRILAREALAESEQRFRQLAENINEVFWMANPQQTEILYISPGYEHIWGRSCRSLYEQPRSFLDAIHPDDRERVRVAVLEKHGRGESTDEEYRVVRPDGSERWVRDRGFPVRDGDGRVYRMVGIAEDITEKKRAEESLRDADRRKNEFLATLAHELRNPLAPIRTGLELLRCAEGDPAVLEQARGMMERQVAQMVRLIDDLLDISRITRGRLRLRKERVELARVAQNAIETSRPLLEAQAHELTVGLPAEPIYLEADPTRLAQILSNLLHNAAKYTEKGGHIWLTAEPHDHTVRISVRDTGLGIPSEQLAHIFETFAQTTPALERSQGGLGIGLSLVRGLVELHGGSVEAHSAGPGKGSEFIVCLPAAAVAVEQPHEPGREGAKSRSGRTCRVLVVDDNRDVADSLALMLRLMGHDTHTAHDGLEAAQAAAVLQPEVVLLDIGLPKMNGYEVARHLRAQPWGRGMRIIALTGWGQEEDKRRALEAGCDLHLTKPVEPGALEQLLRTPGKAPFGGGN
jgi:PAS domain S-box-containing protein